MAARPQEARNVRLSFEAVAVGGVQRDRLADIVMVVTARAHGQVPAVEERQGRLRQRRHDATPGDDRVFAGDLGEALLGIPIGVDDPVVMVLDLDAEGPADDATRHRQRLALERGVDPRVLVLRHAGLVPRHVADSLLMTGGVGRIVRVHDVVGAALNGAPGQSQGHEVVAFPEDLVPVVLGMHVVAESVAESALSAEREPVIFQVIGVFPQAMRDEAVKQGDRAVLREVRLVETLDVVDQGLPEAAARRGLDGEAADRRGAAEQVLPPGDPGLHV